MTQPRPGNLLTLKVIHCLRCYDHGYIIDQFDHSKREPCGCQATSNQPAGGETIAIDNKSETVREL